MATNAQVTTIDDRAFQASLRRLSALQGKELGAIVKQSARRLAVNLAIATYPQGRSEQGKKRVIDSIRGDHSRVFKSTSAVYDELEEQQKSQFAWLMSNASPVQVTRFLKDAGLNLRFTRTPRRSDVKRARSPGTGQVPKGSKAERTAPAERVDKLVERASKRVGLAKHGWARVAALLGGTRGIGAKWITSSKGKPNAGQVREQAGRYGAIYTLINNVPYVSKLLNRSAIVFAMNKESRFLRQQVDRELNKRWNR